MNGSEEILTQDRITKALLYVQYSMIELEKHGYIENLPFAATEKGLEGFKLLKESGFRPTLEEVQLATQTLMDKRTYE